MPNVHTSRRAPLMVVAFATLARKLRLPYPLVLLVTGEARLQAVEGNRAGTVRSAVR